LFQACGKSPGNDDGVTFADFSISETQTIVLDKVAAPCKIYNESKSSLDETAFTRCFKDHFKAELASRVKCSTPYYDDYLGVENKLEECQTQKVTRIY
jgi:hypothetical protein